jgi:Fe-S-cluster containining protein
MNPPEPCRIDNNQQTKEAHMISDILTDAIDAINEYHEAMPVEFATNIAVVTTVTVMDALRMYFDATPSMHEEHGTIIEDLRTAIVNVDVRDVQAARDRFLQLVRELRSGEPASEPPSLGGKRGVMTHDDVVADWQENAEKHDEKNYKFLLSLKERSRSMKERSFKKVGRIALQLHQEAFSIVDCTRCANCCRTMRIPVTEEDMPRIAGHLGMAPEEFIAAYLEQDKEDGGYRMKTIPCPFLGDDNKCKIYDVRPENCRGYPFTDKPDFPSRSITNTLNAMDCPAVFYIVEKIKRRLGR